MITAWQFASLPIWGIGFSFTISAIALGLSKAPDDQVKQRDKMGTCGVALCFGVPFLILAAWMWST